MGKCPLPSLDKRGREASHCELGYFKTCLSVEVIAKWIANNHRTIQLMQMDDHILENSKRVTAYNQPEWHPT